MSAAWDLESDAALVPVEALTRKPRVRGRTVSIKRLSKRALDAGRIEANAWLRELAPSERRRPADREACLPGGRNAQRPCPYVSCKYHLALDVSPKSGAIKLNFPGLEVWEMRETCSLDVADRGGVALEGVGALMNLTRERIRQVETMALARVRPVAVAALRDYAEPEATAEASPNEPEHDDLREPAQTADVIAALAELQVPLGGPAARFDAPSWGSR